MFTPFEPEALLGDPAPDPDPDFTAHLIFAVVERCARLDGDGITRLRDMPIWTPVGDCVDLN